MTPKSLLENSANADGKDIIVEQVVLHFPLGGAMRPA
jgi:hypothetical protein